MRRFERVTGRARREGTAFRGLALSGFTAGGVVAASINEIRIIRKAFLLVAAVQPGVALRVAGCRTSRPKGRSAAVAGPALAIGNVIIYHDAMNAPRRLLGLAASLVGTLGQLGVIAATAPAMRECIWSSCIYGHPDLMHLFIGWEPYIDNAGVGARSSNERRCPGAQGAGSPFRLDYAPLPAGFDAHGYSGSDILACVRLGMDGSVEAVRIVAGTGKARLDSRLLSTIYRQWRFRPVDGVEDGSSWQRVRLNSDYGSGPVTAIPPLPL